MKYRKKPLVIEAQQFFVNTLDGWPQGVYVNEGEYYVDTLEGPLHVSEGDWIIQGVMGEIYPCKPDIFDMTYEPAANPGAV